VIRAILAGLVIAAALLADPAVAQAAEPPTQESWWNTGEKYKNQFRKSDVRIWLSTIFPKDYKEEASRKEALEVRQIVGRLFLLLGHSGVEFRRSFRKKKWDTYPYSTASILSHGGKLMLMVKKDVPIDDHALLNWIINGELEGDEVGKNKVLKKAWWNYKKIALGMEPYDTELDYDDGEVHEVKVKKTDIKSDEGYWGMNLPIGGYGGVDLQGNAIDDTGHHGHLLVYYKVPPKDDETWRMCYLITILPSAPVGYRKSTKGLESHLFGGVDPKVAEAKAEREREGEGTGESEEPGDKEETEEGVTEAPKGPPAYVPGVVSVTGGQLWGDLTCPKHDVRDSLRIIVGSDDLDKVMALAKKELKSESKIEKLLKNKPLEDETED
jgi:hypothetical protein